MVSFMNLLSISNIKMSLISYLETIHVRLHVHRYAPFLSGPQGTYKIWSAEALKITMPRFLHLSMWSDSPGTRTLNLSIKSALLCQLS